MVDNKLQTLRGFRDFLPPQAIKRNWLKEKIVKTFELWGYDPLETPTLESVDLFKGVIGEDEKLFYQFEDQGGRKVALRYDQTVPAGRVVALHQNKITLPFKRYQIQPAFRSEKPQKGRYREFLQCDADIFGVESPVADSEVIALSLDIYRRLGFKGVVARINNRVLIKDIPYDVLISVDKLKKIGEEKVLAEIQKKGFSLKNGQDYLAKVKNSKPDKTLQTIFENLKSFGFSPDWFVFDPTIIRSFLYSDGPIWEIEVEEYTGGSVLGGERYDNLIYKIAGKKITGVGFGLGFDRTLEAAEQLGLVETRPTTVHVLVTVFSEDLREKSAQASNLLRKSGINTDLYSDVEVRLDKQLKYADKKGIPYVIILGPEEAEKGVVQLKNFKKNSQVECSLEECIKMIKSQDVNNR